MNLVYSFGIHTKKEEDKHIKNKNFIAGILAIALLMLAGIACNNYGTKLEFKGGDLYYTNNATEADARKLGEYLVKEEYFDGNPKTVQLDKSGSTNQVRMVIQKEKQTDQGVIDAMKIFAAQISSEVFGNAATEIHICDEELKTVQVVKP